MSRQPFRSFVNQSHLLRCRFARQQLDLSWVRETLFGWLVAVGYVFFFLGQKAWDGYGETENILDDIT